MAAGLELQQEQSRLYTFPFYTRIDIIRCRDYLLAQRNGEGSNRTECLTCTMRVSSVEGGE